MWNIPITKKRVEYFFPLSFVSSIHREINWAPIDMFIVDLPVYVKYRCLEILTWEFRDDAIDLSVYEKGLVGIRIGKISVQITEYSKTKRILLN